ncbi:unnamed protein product [Colias eurytheme]|nr:unnamed protein product [Colias eurytheme]
MEDQENSLYTDVIDRLYETFNGSLERNVVATVVESYEGDLDQSANALMNIAGDLNPANFGQQRPGFNSNIPHAFTNFTPNYNHPLQNAVSYAHASQTARQSNQPPPTAAAAASPATPTAASTSTATSTATTTRAPIATSIATPPAKPVPQPTPQPAPKKIFSSTQWNDTIREVILNYNNGWRILVLMRGASGSGKTFLSREILQMTVGIVKNDQTHIMSTDDYFMHRGTYRHDRNRLHDAHLWNQIRAQKAMSQGISPVIIDNTNIEIWEMDPYVKAAVNNGYIVTVVEPQTPWSKKVHQLVKKNVHNVPFSSIQRMLDNYQNGITGDMLVSICGIKYPANLTPPVMRRFPPLPIELQNNISGTETDASSPSSTPIQNDAVSSNALEGALKNASSIQNENIEDGISESAIGNVASNCNSELQTDKLSTDVEMVAQYTDDKQANVKTKTYAEFKQQLEKFEQVEKAWDNGEQWEENIQEASSSQASLPSVSKLSKPPRNREKRDIERPIISLNPTNDWSQLSRLPSSSNSSPKIVETTTPVVKKTSSSTGFEIGDTDINSKNNHFKVINAVPRDINIFVPDKIEKIPDQRMFDKSTSTNNELILMKPIRCQNEEQHFKAFRRMFSHIPSAELRDIFENCCGDVNWAVEIVIDGMENRQYPFSNEEKISDDEDDAINIESCQCLAAYNLIPDNRPSILTEKENALVEKVIAESSAPSSSPKKIRKDIPVSDASIQIKRQIEKNVVISDNHYSQHCLKIRKSRRGENDEAGNGDENNEDTVKIENSQFMGKDQAVINDNNEKLFNSENFPDIKEGKYKFKKGISLRGDSNPAEDMESSLNKDEYRNTNDNQDKSYYLEYSDQPGTSKSTEVLEDITVPSTSKTNDCDSDFDDDDCFDEVEKTVNITIGKEFVRQLDRLFGREDMQYPDSVLPKINAPISLLNKINALWMESLTHQLDQENKQTEAMIQQDAEFARELADKEEEMLLAGKESQLPYFSEIMDLDYALSLYQNEVEEWLNSEPRTLADKLSRDKLFDLFPDLPTDFLLNALVSNHNRFNVTVAEVLLSIGKGDILNETNGIEKFLRDKALEDKKRIEEQRTALSAEEWPLLPRDGLITMEEVQQYRDEAAHQLKLRQKSYQKAQDYMQKGLFPAASFFSRAGAYHTKMYEQANSKAAVALAAVNAQHCKSNATLDLHSFHVRESMESLDLFLDIHIQKLRQIKGKNGVRSYTLYFITGRGLHSPSGPRVKPACRKRLKERGLSYYELNPGLLAARVTPHNLLSDEIA